MPAAYSVWGPDMTLRQLATFTVDGTVYGIDIAVVQEVVRERPMTAVPLTPDAVAGLINLRGEVITAIDMRARLGSVPRAEGLSPMNVVVRPGSEPVSLLVDAIGDVVDVSAETFEASPATVQGERGALIVGAYMLEAGLLLVLDVAAAIDLAAAAA